MPRQHVSNRERFPNLCECDMAIRNSVDAERSVSQYNNVSALQRQSFSDNSLATLAHHVMMAHNSKS